MNFLIYVPQMAAYGGMERHVCGLAAVLSRRGHHVELMTTSNSLGPDLRGPLTESGVILREMPLDRAQAREKAELAHKTIWMLRETLRVRRTAWDVIYTNGQSALSRVAWMGARGSTRIVHHHHTAGDAGEQASWSRSFRQVLHRAPQIVACSQATRRELARALRRDDIDYLPYLAACPVEKAAIRDRSYSSDVRLNFGFIGRMVPEKGIGAICALSRRPDLADIAWHLHGAGTGYSADFFRDYPAIRFHGAFRGQESQARALNGLDALVLFSLHNEGMPLSLIEGMSAGLPWIATDRGGTREVALSPANCLVIDPANDLDGMAAAVREMAARLRAGTTSRLAQRRAYDEHFSPAAVATAWCAYLENAAGPVRTPPVDRNGPLKILLVSHAFSPGIGGIETMSRLLADGFSAAGHQVRLVTRTPSPDESGTSYPVLRRPDAAALGRMFAWCDLVVHSNITLHGLWPFLFFRRPWVVIHHTWIFHDSSRLALAPLLKCAVLSGASSISVSRAVAASLPVPSRIIHNCYDSSVFFAEGEESRDRDILFVGRLVPDKGVDLLIHALRKLKEGGLRPAATIVGGGSEEDRLRSLVSRLDLDAQVTFTGFRPAEEVAALMRRHRILAVPSRWDEPFGIVALEGMASGCAVVGSSGGGLAEAIGPAGRTFQSGNADALARALALELRSPSPVREATLRHLADHRPERIVRQYLDHFEALLHPPARPVV